jgi:integrase
MSDLRIALNDKAIARLARPESGQYKARDVELKGFYLLVGKRRRTFMVQGDLRQAGVRTSSIKVSVGDAAFMSTRDARSIAKAYLGEIGQGRHPKPREIVETPAASLSKGGITLREAWTRYRDAHLMRKGRSAVTIEGYRDHVERVFKDWLDWPLKELADDPGLVAARHDEVTLSGGPYTANSCMRTLRAIYNHARRKSRELPPLNPVDSVDWNPEERRNTAMGASDLPDWFRQLAAFENPIRREFHLMTLLSGCRPSALKAVRTGDFNFARRVLHIPSPKGGAKRAFDIPLSREMIKCIIRSMRYGRVLHPDQATEWLFPANSASGHLAAHKEDRAELSKLGNDLRQTYRTIATIAEVSDVDAKLLMNHAISGVNQGYITRHKLLEDHLRERQQAISTVMFANICDEAHCGSKVDAWLGAGAAKRATLLKRQ